MSKHKSPIAGPVLLDDLLSVEQAAERLGIKPGTVYKYFGRGLLKKTRHGASVWVHRDEVARFSVERRPPGKPSKLA